MSLRKIIKNKVGFNKNNIEDEEDSDETKLKTKLEEVELQNFSFVPSKVKILVGSSIRWTNRHAAKNDDQIKWVKCRSESASQQESPVIKANQSFTHTFTESGTFQCHSIIYPWVKSTIVVMKDLATIVNVNNVSVNLNDLGEDEDAELLTAPIVYYRNKYMKTKLEVLPRNNNNNNNNNRNSLHSPSSTTISSETSPSFMSEHGASSYGSSSFMSSSGIDDFGGDESYEASDTYSNDENEYNANNKYDNYDEDEHADYGTDSSGSFAGHDEDRDTEGGIISVYIDEMEKANVRDIREVKINGENIKLSKTSITVPCGGIVVWSYSKSGNAEVDDDNFSEFSKFSKFQFKKETNFPGNDKSDFILCYTSPSLRSSKESNVALCLQFCQPGRFFI